MLRTLLFAIVGALIIAAPYIDIGNDAFILPGSSNSRRFELSMDAILILIVAATVLLSLKKRLALFGMMSFFLWFGETVEFEMVCVIDRGSPKLTELKPYLVKCYEHYMKTHSNFIGSGSIVDDLFIVLKFFIVLCVIMGIVLVARKIYQKHVKMYIVKAIDFIGKK